MRTMSELRAALLKGCVIPAHPLALRADRKLNERRQVALTRYYCDAGAGGIAVGVHTTQFAIHEPRVGLFDPVLRLASDAVQNYQTRTRQKLILVAGLCGDTSQAAREASLAATLDFDAGLLSLSALREAPNSEIIQHCSRVAEILPLFGFYLQPAVGGRRLDFEFWSHFLEIENVVAVKIAPFNRYYTLDVVRALAESGRQGEVALYTGNDDNIIVDLLADFPMGRQGSDKPLRFSGGLLGQWSVWTHRAVEILKRVQDSRKTGTDEVLRLLGLANQLTDANAALFDVRHDFSGCIAGLHEILQRRGLLEGTWCLDPKEDLSPGQREEIDRVCNSYPHLTDDDFVAENLDRWLN